MKISKPTKLDELAIHASFLEVREIFGEKGLEKITKVKKRTLRKCSKLVLILEPVSCNNLSMRIHHFLVAVERKSLFLNKNSLILEL